MTSKDDELILKKLSQRKTLKRKLDGKPNNRPTKKQKTVGVERGLNDLDWKVVARPSAAGIDEAGGMLMLEEVEGIDVYYEETPKGKVAKFRQGRDVIGIAQTGSGKTLAFGLPILHDILSQPKNRSSRNHQRRLKALIITPTRELALQVMSHLNSCAPPRSEEQQMAHLPPRISIAAIVGGMSSHKQSRLIERGADIIVATPGRLWELLSESDGLAMQVRNIRFLVLDEADRMIENGHFAELENILRLTSRPDPTSIEAGMESVELNDKEKGRGQPGHLQTFVFSATMNKDLQKNLKRFKRTKGNGSKGSTVADDLLLRLDFRDAQPAIIDLSPKDGVVSTFQESRVECLNTDKDVYLYYFLLRYPGRSLVFLSSIDGVRRLTPLLSLLEIKAWAIHSQMQQKQRLKNLDR
ncbi:ATP-dependent RNA helicase, partial [Serendipita sp. 399]